VIHPPFPYISSHSLTHFPIFLQFGDLSHISLLPRMSHSSTGVVLFYLRPFLSLGWSFDRSVVILHPSFSCPLFLFCRRWFHLHLRGYSYILRRLLLIFMPSSSSLVFSSSFPHSELFEHLPLLMEMMPPSIRWLVSLTHTMTLFHAISYPTMKCNKRSSSLQRLMLEYFLEWHMLLWESSVSEDAPFFLGRH
jgi:hypothetical protein